jgi:hypothetical protein
VGDNAADIGRWEREDISLDDLRRRLSTQVFEYDPIFLHTTVDANGNVTSFWFEFPGVSCR